MEEKNEFLLHDKILKTLSNIQQKLLLSNDTDDSNAVNNLSLIVKDLHKNSPLVKEFTETMDSQSELKEQKIFFIDNMESLKEYSQNLQDAIKTVESLENDIDDEDFTAISTDILTLSKIMKKEIYDINKKLFNEKIDENVVINQDTVIDAKENSSSVKNMIDDIKDATKKEKQQQAFSGFGKQKQTNCPNPAMVNNSLRSKLSPMNSLFIVDDNNVVCYTANFDSVNVAMLNKILQQLQATSPGSSYSIFHVDGFVPLSQKVI